MSGSKDERALPMADFATVLKYTQRVLHRYRTAPDAFELPRYALAIGRQDMNKTSPSVVRKCCILLQPLLLTTCSQSRAPIEKKEEDNSAHAATPKLTKVWCNRQIEFEECLL